MDDSTADGATVGGACGVDGGGDLCESRALVRFDFRGRRPQQTWADRWRMAASSKAVMASPLASTASSRTAAPTTVPAIALAVARVCVFESSFHRNRLVAAVPLRLSRPAPFPSCSRTWQRVCDLQHHHSNVLCWLWIGTT